MKKIIRETSIESYNKIKGTKSERYKMCLETLDQLGEVTANELAMNLFLKGELPYFTRNFVHPRLNELVEMKKVKEHKKRICTVTGRLCICYSKAGVIC